MDITERQIRYIEKIPGAIQGKRGQTALFDAARVFKLSEPGNGLNCDQITALLWEYFNPRCSPPWTDSQRKDFNRQCERGYRAAETRGTGPRPNSPVRNSFSGKPQTKRTSPQYYSSVYIPAGNGLNRRFIERFGGMEREFVLFGGPFDTYIEAGAEKTPPSWLFEYRDANGGPHLLWKRTAGARKPNGKREKHFYPYHWNTAEQNYSPGILNFAEIPFCYPRVIRSRGVILVEGEKAALFLNSFLHFHYSDSSIVATSFPHGAQSWHDSRAEFFRGKDVYLWPDNDDAGRKYMTQAAESLKETAENIWTFRQYPHYFTPGDDAVEVLEIYKGRTKGQGNPQAETLPDLVRELFFDFDETAPDLDFEANRDDDEKPTD